MSNLIRHRAKVDRNIQAGPFLARLVMALVVTIGVVSLAEAAGYRKYYLTFTTHDGSEALTACVKKFHMASLWEIFDTTKLHYATELGPGVVVATTADQGSGPPVSGDAGQGQGWVRTGNGASTFNAPGRANCNAWTSNGNAEYGTVGSLMNVWFTDVIVFVLPVNPWAGGTSTCNAPLPVWCVEDKER